MSVRFVLAVGCFVTLGGGCADKHESEERMTREQVREVPQEHTVGGKTVAEAFPDPRLANLARAACADDITTVEAAIKSGVDPNATGLDGVTPLVWVQRCESLSGAEALLKAGANPNANFAGRSAAAVYFAATMSNPAFLKLALKYGGDPNSAYMGDPKAPSQIGHTALWVAFDTGLDHRGWDNYYALLDAGADINRIHENDTIAEYAVFMNSFDKVAELLERGYTTRLDYLGWITQEHYFADSPEFVGPKIKQRDRVIKMLKARGIKFPIPSLPASAPPGPRPN